MHICIFPPKEFILIILQEIYFILKNIYYFSEKDTLI